MLKWLPMTRWMSIGRREEAEAKKLEELAGPAGFLMAEKPDSTVEKIQRR
jgi:hypothetical protein